VRFLAQPASVAVPTAPAGNWSEGYYGASCKGFGLVKISNYPDRLILQAMDELLCTLAHMGCQKEARYSREANPIKSELLKNPALAGHSM
jgi:hypothetical protein